MSRRLRALTLFRALIAFTACTGHDTLGPEGTTSDELGVKMSQDRMKTQLLDWVAEVGGLSYEIPANYGSSARYPTLLGWCDGPAPRSPGHLKHERDQRGNLATHWHAGTGSVDAQLTAGDDVGFVGASSSWAS